MKFCFFIKDLTFCGDCGRVDALRMGTGLGSEIGRVLGLGGLEFEEALLYLKKIFLFSIIKYFLIQKTHFLSYSLESTGGKLLGTNTKSSELSGLVEVLLFSPSPKLRSDVFAIISSRFTAMQNKI